MNAEFFEPLSKQGLFYEPDFCDIVYRCPIRYDGLMQALSKDGQQMVAKIAEWCSNQPVKLCVLFGSQATGRQRPDSNVDLALWPSRMPLAQTKLTWLHELETLLDKPVNLALVSADLDPVLGFEIVRDGRLLQSCVPTGGQRRDDSRRIIEPLAKCCQYAQRAGTHV